MGVLVVRCPKTRRRFSTGIQIEREDFQHIYEDVVTSSHCPYCNTEHQWHYRDAEFVDAIPPNDWVENR